MEIRVNGVEIAEPAIHERDFRTQFADGVQTGATVVEGHHFVSLRLAERGQQFENWRVIFNNNDICHNESIFTTSDPFRQDPCKKLVMSACA